MGTESATATAVDLARHSPSVPFVRTLGAVWLGGDAAGIRMRLPFAAAVADDAGAIDLRAAVALLDHAGGAAVYAAVPSTATATLELRVDLTGLPEPGRDVGVTAALVAQQHGSALVRGQAASACASAPFMHMSARYIVGSGPGQAPADAAYAAARETAVARYATLAAQAMGSFDDTLGGHLEGPIWQLPFAERLVGSVTLPALHGGVVAAGLMTAAMHGARQASALQLAALTVRYLRPARARDTVFEACVTKAGSRALFVEAQALQGGRPVAAGQALFG